MEERHVSLSTVAGRLGVSERTVRRWIKAGKLRAYRPGRDFRIPESAFKEFVEESEIAPKVGSSSPDPKLFYGIDGEQHFSLKSWIDFAGRLADRWEREIEEREVALQTAAPAVRSVKELPNLNWALEIMDTYTDVVEAYASDPNAEARVYDPEEERELRAAIGRLRRAVNHARSWFSSAQESPQMADVIDLRQAAIERAEKKLDSRAS